MTEFYTPLYEWAARWDELSLPEALVLCRIKYWANAGCFESYATLAQLLKLGQRTVIRAVMSLHEKDLIKIVREGKYKRTLFFNFSNTNLPLFDKKVVPHRHQVVPQCPKVMPKRHMINHTKQEKTKEKIELTADLMRQENKMSASAKQKRKQELLEQCKKMNKELYK